MSRSKSKNRPSPIPPDYVHKNDVFATFVDQAQSLGNEVAARRRFDADVSEFLKTKGLVAEFETFRKSREPKV